MVGRQMGDQALAGGTHELDGEHHPRLGVVVVVADRDRPRQLLGVLVAGMVFDRFGGPPIFAASALVLAMLGLRFARRLAADYRTG